MNHRQSIEANVPIGWIEDPDGDNDEEHYVCLVETGDEWEPDEEE